MFYYYLDKNSGILLMCDRFSYAVGVNSEGERLTIGGWGSRLIEDGSEYYIGLSAIKAAISEYEMLGGRTQLTEAIKDKLKVKNLNELKYILYYKTLNDKKIQSLSKEVLKCARQGDRISLNIINSAADKLFNMADILIRRLNMYDKKYSLCLTGSIVCFDEYITNPLCDKIYNRYDNIEVFTHKIMVTKE
ncbi:BadF/BadG/BcrA/BcrD ATPase family protein [Clostridium rhizosphaerae]|nr:BadF/BadG/BcrA/BcrD ATPase family protein [Clostridium rhizosphaerae]